MDLTIVALYTISDDLLISISFTPIFFLGVVL